LAGTDQKLLGAVLDVYFQENGLTDCWMIMVGLVNLEDGSG
jgi:hypothetical protein